MNRDGLKTTGAIVLIIAIVGATFWYGNRQRQTQIKHDQQVQDQAKKSSSTSSSATTTGSNAPTPAPASKNPTPTPPASSSTNPAPTPQTTPQTGGEIAYLLPVGALILGYRYKRNSQENLKKALLSS